MSVSNRFKRFNCGMGIGGWLTNYKRFNVLPMNWRLPLNIGDYEHFATYIQERDIAYIAECGFDHIRVGFDQIVIEEAPGKYREETLQHLDHFVEWCEKYRLGAVLNLHKAVGNYCDIQEDVSLMDSPELQQRFIDLWLMMEKRYAGKDEIVFEILNEVRNIPPEQWNDLADRTVKALRTLNPSRKIILGTTCWNSPSTLKHLHVYGDDENIGYSWHFYSPFEFTHQRGVLQAGPLFYNREMPYPGDIERYRDYQRVVNGSRDPYPGATEMNIVLLQQFMQDALDFAGQHPDKFVWCGEFGTIRHCPIRYRENYMHDVISLLKSHHIPYCVWNYLSTPNDGNRFSLVDDETRKILSPRLKDILLGNF